MPAEQQQPDRERDAAEAHPALLHVRDDDPVDRADDAERGEDTEEAGALVGVVGDRERAQRPPAVEHPERHTDEHGEEHEPDRSGRGTRPAGVATGGSGRRA